MTKYSHQYESQLANITSRGYDLYNYDVSCWLASDTLVTYHPDNERLGQFLAKDNDSVWTVYFGKSSQDQNSFIIAYEISLSKMMKILSVKEYKEGKRDSSWLMRASKAITLTKLDFGKQNLTYNYYVFPDTSQNILVYYIPAKTNNKETPLGGDVRYIVSKDGSNILRITRLHKSVIMMPQPVEGAMAGMHSHIIIKTPVETDVFFVLSQRPRLPHYIFSDNGMYIVKSDGEILLENK